MRIVPSVLAALLTVPSLLVAQDPLTRQALQRIEKVEQTEANAAAGDQRVLQGLLSDLDWAQKRLNAVIQRDQTHADAQTRLQAIRAKVEAKKQAPAPTPAPAPAPAPANGTTPPSTGGHPPAGNLPYDRAALQQLDKEIGNTTHNFDLVAQKLWTDGSRRSSMQRDLQALTRRIGQFPAAVPDVQRVAERLAALQQRFDAVAGKVAGDEQAAAAVDAEVDKALQNYAGSKLPKAPEAPIEAAPLRAFLLQLAELRTTDLPRDAAVAEAALANTAANHQRAGSLRHAVTSEWPRRLGELEVQVRAQVQGAAKDAVRHAEWLLATDPKDRNQVTNRVLARGAFDQQMTMLRRSVEAIAAATTYDELVPAEAMPATERQAQSETVQKAIRHLQALAVATLDAVRVPTAVSTDPELLQIAEATLKKPDYQVGSWLRLVINAPKVRRERREASVQHGAVRSTVTSYTYVWDEFQVTTVEKVGDETWLFYNTLKLYHSGDSTTPIGRWILSQRFESTRILPENVDK